MQDLNVFFCCLVLRQSFLFAGANVLPTSKNNRKYIENQLSGAIEEMEEYIRKYPNFQYLLIMLIHQGHRECRRS